MGNFNLQWPGQQQGQQSQLASNGVQPGATASTFGRFDAARPAASPGNIFSEAAAQFPITPGGNRPGYALPNAGAGGGPGSIGNFSVTGQAEELPSGLGGSRTTSALQNNPRNYLMTGQANQGGGLITSPGDVDFFLDQGIITPEQADALRLVGQQNQKELPKGATFRGHGGRPGTQGVL